MTNLPRNPDGEAAFDFHLARVVTYFRKSCPKATWSEVRFFEGEPLDGRFLSTNVLLSPSDYRARFCELLEEGYSWLNLSASGVLDDWLILSVEWPQYGNSTPREYVSVNLSGPRFDSDGNLAWNLSNRIEITG